MGLPTRESANLRVFGELEDAKDAQNSYECEGTAALGALAVSLGLLDDKDDEVREDGEHVDDVHHVTTEVRLRRARRQTHEELTREPYHAHLHTHRQTDSGSDYHSNLYSPKWW